MPKKFKIEDAKPMKTLMSSSIKLDKDEHGVAVDTTQYRGMIGSFLYLTASRLDIMFSVGLCARFQSNPKESHLSAIKCILLHISGTKSLGLLYSKGSHVDLLSFSDAD